MQGWNICRRYQAAQRCESHEYISAAVERPSSILKETIQPRDLVLDLAGFARNALLFDDAREIQNHLLGPDRRCLMAWL